MRRSPYVGHLVYHKSEPAPLLERKVVVQMDSDKFGNLEKKNTVQMKSIYDGLHGLRCSDFSLQNLVLSGAISQLKPVATFSRDRLTNADMLVNQSNNIQQSYDDLQTEAEFVAKQKAVDGTQAAAQTSSSVAPVSEPAPQSN